VLGNAYDCVDFSRISRSPRSTFILLFSGNGGPHGLTASAAEGVPPISGLASSVDHTRRGLVAGDSTVLSASVFSRRRETSIYICIHANSHAAVVT
jgi:hypothetical protein